MVPERSAFEPWLRRLDGFASARVTDIRVADGGASNITCRATIEDAPLPAVALRVQRERGIFEPYDVIREGEVIRCLGESVVPVPRMLGSESSSSFLGAPFIVMEWVDAPHMGMASEASFPAFTRAVVSIHQLDWRGLGLSFLGVPRSPKDAVKLELEAVARRMKTFGSTDAVLGRALDLLQQRVPADGELSLCQGDINIFNYLFRGREVAAVVDWEQAHIGDARSDVGQLVALSHLKGAPFGPAEQTTFVQAYEAASGKSLRNMEYFRAFWLFELGVIYRGWVAFNASQPWYSWDYLTELLEAALAEIA